MEVM
jgi:hypothetical protein